ncbi:MAG: HlyD family efflux transporter periplasmic adaptor subunit [Pseudarcicella sp.]|nr:HlyD family efflux transporter periplasmic adaptor subunit [Pseudarcicella sp.]
MDKVDELDVYSESVKDFLERIPSWIVRWGITVIFLVVLAMLWLSYWVHYPEIVSAPLKLTSIDAPKNIVARADGKLVKLLVADKQMVKQGQLLGYLESTADYSAVQEAQKKGTTKGKLGELQSSYQVFEQARNQYNSFKQMGFYEKRKSFIHKEINDLKKLAQNLREQQAIEQQDLKISEIEYQIQQKLADQKVIAPLDLKREESKFIAKKKPMKGLESAIINNSTAQTSKERELMDLDKTISEQESLFLQAKNTFLSNIEAWKLRYVLYAPADGIVSFSDIIQEKMQVSNNQELFQLTAATEQVLGLIQIPQENFGKVKEGQQVLVKFNSHPFQEFGIVSGKVASISLIPQPQAETYMAKVVFPQGLKTNFDKQIHYRNGMKASAEIVTEDLRLIERLLYQFRKIFSR